MTRKPSPNRRLGQWAALAAAILSAAYVGGQLLEWAGLLGSAGGPGSSSTAGGIVVLLLPSLLLGSAFVLAMAALHSITPRDRRAFSTAAVAFAAVYASLTGLVYFVQLTFVAPRLAAGTTASIDLLLFRPYRSFLFAVDLLGYAMMCLSCLCAAFAVTPGARRLKQALAANGALAPFLALQMQFPVLIWPAAAWAVTFPLAMILLWRHFLGGTETK